MATGLGQLNARPGFSLGEMMAALVIGAMVLTGILAVYARANRGVEATLARIDNPSVISEVLQLIAEDLDTLLGADEDATVQIANGYDRKLARAQLVLRRVYKDSENAEQTFEQIIWRAVYDYESDVPGLVLYRSHDGIALEDNLLDEDRESWESNYTFVPICRGLTFFQIEVAQGDGFVDQWSASSLPPGVRITLSFGTPYETVRGTLDVIDEEKTTRTIAVNRIRKIPFGLATPDVADGEVDEAESTDEQEPEEERQERLRI